MSEGLRVTQMCVHVHQADLAPEESRALGALEDSGFIFELYNMPSFIKYIGNRNIQTVGDAEQYIQSNFYLSLRRWDLGIMLLF